MTTCMESSNNVAYMFYNLLGEVGELTEKMNVYVQDIRLKGMSNTLGYFGQLAKTIRKEPGNVVTARELETFEPYIGQFKKDKDLQKEIGDIMWQLNGLMTVLGLSAEDIAQQNLDKLASRKQRDKIDGDGDNR